jgi:hypothetical protein
VEKKPKPEELSEEELAAQNGEELPDRDVMTLVTPEVIEGDVLLPPPGGPEE